MALYEGQAMTNKDKKEILNSYRALDHQERLLSEVIEYTRERYLAHSPNYDGMPHGGTQKDLSDYAAKVDGLLTELYAVMDKKHDALRTITEAIEALPTEGEKLLLRLRYIKHLKWEAVALEMELPVRRVYYLHGTALSHFMEGKDDG